MFGSYLWSPGGQTTQAITATASGTYSVQVTTNGCSGTSAGTTVTVNPLPTPTISAGGPTTFCAGGSVTLTSTSGGSYLWSPGGQTTQAISVTSSGTYSVQVTTNGCTGTSAGTAVTVNPLPTPTSLPVGTTTFCAGGSVTLTSTSGGSYLWSPGGQTTQAITATASGTYSVQVTTNGCSGTSTGTTVTVNPLPTPTISAGGPTTFCAGGSVTLTSTAGGSYLWSPSGQTHSGDTAATTSGTYSVQVTTGGCSGTSAGTTVTVSPLPTPTISAGGPTTFCAGGSVTLTSTSGGSYLWSPGGQTTQAISVNSSGTYSVQVTTGGCSGTSAGTTVTVNLNPTAVITAGGPTTFCAGGSVTLTSTSGTSYLWSPGGQTTQSISATASGSYTVTVSNANQCNGTSQPTVVTVNPAPAPPTITPDGPTTFCSGGSVLLTSSSATGNVWNPGGSTNQSISVTTGGSYTVTFTNGNGCSATSGATVVTVNTNCDCLGVPGGTAIPGSACNDGNAGTVNDVYQANCVCAGVLPNDCLGVPGGPAQPGTACNDNNPLTGNDVYGANCVCAGELIDCLGVAGGPALPGTACNDGLATTGNDVYGANCICGSLSLPVSPVARLFPVPPAIDCLPRRTLRLAEPTLGVPGGTALPGSTCDDGLATTGNDVYGANCVCASTS